MIISFKIIFQVYTSTYNRPMSFRNIGFTSEIHLKL